jgi:molybdenum cofactor cytidylyltransferase
MSTESKTIGAVILAAGFGRRFGSDKRLAKLATRTVAETTLQTYASVFDHVRIVLRSEDQVLASLLAPYGEIVLTDHAHLGMGHSLAAGFADLNWQWGFVGLADMPFVASSTLALLIDEAKRCDKAIVRPHFEQSTDAPAQPPHGHPIGFHCSLFAALAQLSGDAGARQILRAHPDQIHDVAVVDKGVIRDIDKPEDLGSS